MAISSEKFFFKLHSPLRNGVSVAKKCLFYFIFLHFSLRINSGPDQRIYDIEHLDVVSFNPREQFFVSRNPVSSDAEAIYVKGELWWFKTEAFVFALLASGFRQNNTAFTPCPLGTFKNLSTKGADGCQNCTPGNFKLLFSIQ